MTLLNWLKQHNILDDFVKLLEEITELRELVAPYWFVFNFKDVQKLVPDLQEKEKLLLQIWKEYRFFYPDTESLHDQLQFIISDLLPHRNETPDHN